MNFLEERIVKDGIVKPGNVLKVDSFLNHQMDVTLMDQMGEEFKRRFADKTITKVLTIESSGIGIACSVARAFQTPMVLPRANSTAELTATASSLFRAELTPPPHRWNIPSLTAVFPSRDVIPPPRQTTATTG